MTDEQLDKHVLLYECCQLTKGYGRTLLVDMQRKNIEFLDNELYELLTFKARKNTVREMLGAYSDEDKQIVTEYIEYLLAGEYAFLCEKAEVAFFTSLNKEWDYFSVINNCILDIDTPALDFHLYEKIFRELDALGCENLQIRCYSGISQQFLASMLDTLTSTNIFRIELLLKHTGEYTIDACKNILQQYPRINELIIHSYEKEEIVKLESDQIFFLTEQNISDESHCGIISTAYFNIDIQHFTESFGHNTCLNRKVGIDSKGNIKNCPSLKNIYGNIATDSITDVVHTEPFRATWFIAKSQVETCKICEFRNICTDCRAFHQEDINTNKPYKCTYDPIEMVWNKSVEEKNMQHLTLG